MEIEAPRRSPSPPLPDAAAVAAAAAAAVSSVLGDDDLLREILLRVGLPTSLLRGALVCRRWYGHASDPAFLRRFRDRHPPRVLGVYLDAAAGGSSQRPRFHPIRPVPELAAAARRAASFFDAFRGSSASILDSRGGRLLVSAFDDRYESTQFVCSPLSPAADTVVVPPPPPPPPTELTSNEECIIYHYGELLPDDGDARSSYFCVVMGYSEQQTTVHQYELQDMYWVVRASAAAQLPVSPPKSRVMLFDNTKFYMLSATNKILVCDFASSSISAMELPSGVANEHTGSIMLSRGDGCGIYLISVKEPQLHMFFCKVGGNNASNWLLVDTICLDEVCLNLGMTSCAFVDGQSAGVKIRAVGDNVKFVILEMFGAIVFLDMTSRQAEKVYEMMPEDPEFVRIHPLMLIWPPVFPRLKEECDENW
ncbi:hypothetical protein ACP70R_015479 [Stipagrostis hirtigluma subsp. patula]